MFKVREPCRTLAGSILATAAAQGLHGFCAAAQGFCAAQGLQTFIAAHGLHGLAAVRAVSVSPPAQAANRNALPAISRAPSRASSMLPSFWLGRYEWPSVGRIRAPARA